MGYKLLGGNTTIYCRGGKSITTFRYPSVPAFRTYLASSINRACGSLQYVITRLRDPFVYFPPPYASIELKSNLAHPYFKSE
ncbi:hypothetical protein BABINDRAFT_162525 [Babjeviella inositovora NRRL Y-12698]|uniref:Uncharacterized protein n=1 Tax=Babjeviella inositovora NRRL Y-12698 TaxID=984486 RepID=A0A1E3QMB8_9ASCO|nr:uncharacterized protein BABINDRAFT_162525 [Babjeviella inositovora NRRL Y-12698]ODQ78849.1 hypothetical protein BABINDRAFT_162525 [Babjeviella inositovora NRRL Y-12698]